MRTVAIVIAGLLLATHTVVSAQQPSTPAAPAAASSPAPAAQAAAPQAAPAAQAASPDGPTPPLKAVVVKLQLALLERERTIAQLQQRLTELESQQLQAAIKNVVEPELLKELNAKPGDTFDWNSLALRPAPAASEPAGKSKSTP